MKLLPSLLYPDFEQFSARFTQCVELGGEVHIDFADGEFVANRLPSIEKVISLPGDIDIEAHLMVQDPARWVESALRDERFRTIIFHAEADVDIAELAITIKQARRRVGLALKPETPIEHLKSVLNLLDQVLVLFVKPGFNGSPFIPDMAQKIVSLRQLYPQLIVEADGGMNPETLHVVKAAGAHKVAIGSYLHNKNLEQGLSELSMHLERGKT